MRGVEEWPAGKRSKWAVLAVWLIAGAVTLPAFGKLESVTTDDQTAFLPKSAESTRLIEAQDALSGNDLFDVSVVYRRAQGQLSEAEQARAQSDYERLTQRYPQAGKARPVAISTDRKAALVNLSIPGITDDNDQLQLVRDIRSAVGEGANGLDIKVTGPGGFIADFEEANEDIDVTLLAATLGIVSLVLLITYRSPILWLFPILAIAFGDAVATALVYQLASHDVLTLDGNSAHILPVLVFGVGTDYALLLLARDREELHRQEDRHVAMAVALRRAGPTIAASGAIVVIGMLCLLASELNSNQSLAVVGAVSIGFTVIASLTLLPAMLVMAGRKVFWPFVPLHGDPLPESSTWRRIGERVAARPVAIAGATVAALSVVAIAGIVFLDTGLRQVDMFSNNPDSVKGQEQIERSFPIRAGDPLLIIFNTRQQDQVRQVLATTRGVEFAVEIDRSEPGPNADCAQDPDDPSICVDRNGKTEYVVDVEGESDSQEERGAIRLVRDELHKVSGGGVIVGGPPAERLDMAASASHDQAIVVPLVLLVVFVIFCLLLRAVTAPALLILTVLLSYATSLGACMLVSKFVLGFPALDPIVPFLGFVFLVALGIDYNVFLATRIREEAQSRSTRDATLVALTATGGVITSAGAVLAATFAVLAVVPLVAVIELGFLVAFGVLLDTFIVRSILVPALFVRLDERAWWPSRISR